MGHSAVCAFFELSPTRLTSAAKRGKCAAASLGNRVIYSNQPINSIHSYTAAFLRSDRTTPRSPAFPISRVSFSSISGVSSPPLIPLFSFHRSYAAIAAPPPSPDSQESSPEPQLPIDDLRAAVEAVRRSADSGSLYLLESRLAEALPDHAEAKAKVAAIRELVTDLEKLKQEKAKLAMFRHQTPKEIRSEYAQMMLTGLFTGLAAAIHPILFIGTIVGLIRMRSTKRAEVDRDGTKKMEEVNRTVKEKRAELKAHIDALADIVGR